MVINLILLVKYTEDINHFTVKLRVLPVQSLFSVRQELKFKHYFSFKYTKETAFV